MTAFIGAAHAAQNGHRFRGRRLVELDELEATRQGGVLFEILLIFAPGRRSDGAQFAARQGRLQQIGRIAAARRAAGAHQRMRFIDEQNERPRRSLHFVDDPLQPVLEFSFDACARLQHAHIEAEQLDIPKEIGHVALRDLERETLDDRGLADARIADADRIVLAAPAEDVDHLTDFAIAAEDRIDLSGARLRGEVDRESRKRAVGRKGGLTGLGRRRGSCSERRRLFGRFGDDIGKLALQLGERNFA